MPPGSRGPGRPRASTRPSSSKTMPDGNALFHAALRKRNDDLENTDDRVVKPPEEDKQFLPPLPQHRHVNRKSRPKDESALNCDFKYLLLRHGSYAKARHALRAAKDDQHVKRSDRLRKEVNVKMKVLEVKQVISLSNTTGGPTLMNPISKQIEMRKKKHKPPPPPPRVNSREQPRRTKVVGEMTAGQLQVHKMRRMKGLQKEQAAALARDLERQMAVQKAFDAVDDGSGTISQASFEVLLGSLGLGAREPHVELGVPSPSLFRERSDEWWAATDVYKAGRVGIGEAINALPERIYEALDEDKRSRNRIVAYRELLLMESEDFDAEEVREEDLDPILRELRRPTLQYKPFEFMELVKAPPPPAWRDDGDCYSSAWGAPVDAPPLPEDGAMREGWLSVQRHELIVVERGLEYLPLILGSTLLQQLGVTKISMPRNSIRELHCFGRAPAIGCRSLRMLKELRLPGNGLRYLPEDVGLLRSITTADLGRNSLTEFPQSFMELETLTFLDVTRNNFKRLPDDIGELKALTTLLVPDNILQRLPATLPRLHNLEYLDISGNGLAHLCTFAPLSEVARKFTVGERDWDFRRTPLKNVAYYVNTKTGRVQKTMPSMLRLTQEALGALKLGRNSRADAALGGEVPRPDPSLIMASMSYNHRKMALASAGVDEWTVEWSDGDGAMLYTSHVNGERTVEMPSSLDRLGQLRNLLDFRCDNNQLRDLPPSIANMKTLTLFRCRGNYIRRLMPDVGKMQSLKTLDCNQNEMAHLPGSAGKLVKLKFLSLQSNRFEKLPPLVGKLSGLKRLMLGNNALETLPYEIGFLTSLQELQVFNNPLIDPPYHTISNLPAMMWSCRQKYWAILNGPVPVVTAHQTGAGDEVYEPEPAYKIRMARKLEEAAATGRLELQLEGVEKIPGAICTERFADKDDTWAHPSLEGLRILKMSMNHFKEAPLLTASLGNLRVLWLKACEIKVLNDDVDHLQKLRELIIEENELTALPRTFPRLRQLEIFNCARNSIYNVPEDLGNLTALVTLDLSMNRLEHLPDSITNLRQLEELSVSKNDLYKLPNISPHLAQLTTLNLDANNLHLLPERLGELPLRFLRCSHNRLERIYDDTLTGVIQESLEVLGVASNNLLELPACIPACTSLKIVQVEYNPMRNPPAEILSEGVDILLQYCRVREKRFGKFMELMTEFQFDYSEAHMYPEAHGVLTGRTGFLAPEDLAAFDKQADTYLNGQYYACASTDVEILERVDNLRHEREHTFYHTLLTTLIDVIEDELKRVTGAGKRRFGGGVLVVEQRPWDKDGAYSGGYAIALDALVKEGKPDRFRRTSRPPLFDLLMVKLPSSSFDYTLEVLKDAIMKYQDPYGHVSQLDKVEFDRCECVDKNGRPLNHHKCVLPAVCVKKVIYTQGEATRRVQEVDGIISTWRKLWKDIEQKIRQRHGKLIMNNEVHRRKRNVQNKIKKAKSDLDAAKNEVKVLLDKLDIVKRRIENFENGDAFNFHRIASTDEAMDLERDAAKQVDDKKLEVRSHESSLAVAKTHAKMPPKVALNIALEDVKRKYCVMRWEEIVDEARRDAVEYGHRRPWDGDDGESYTRFVQTYGRAIISGQEVDSLPSWIKQLKPDSAQIFKPDPNLPPGVTQKKTQTQVLYELFPYDWNYTDDMAPYSNSIYDDFESEYITDDMAAQNRRIARNLRSLEQTGKAADKNFSPDDLKNAVGVEDPSASNADWRKAEISEADAHAIAEEHDEDD